MTPSEFASAIREKYKAYAGVPDEGLSRAFIEKYPVYASQVDFAPPVTPPEVVIEQPGISTAPLTPPPVGFEAPTLPPSRLQLEEEAQVRGVLPIGATQLPVLPALKERIVLGQRMIAEAAGRAGEAGPVPEITGPLIRGAGALAQTPAAVVEEFIPENVAQAAVLFAFPELTRAAKFYGPKIIPALGIDVAPYLTKAEKAMSGSVASAFKKAELKILRFKDVPEEELYRVWLSLPEKMRAAATRDNIQMRRAVINQGRAASGLGPAAPGAVPPARPYVPAPGAGPLVPFRGPPGAIPPGAPPPPAPAPARPPEPAPISRPIPAPPAPPPAPPVPVVTPAPPEAPAAPGPISGPPAVKIPARAPAKVRKVDILPEKEKVLAELDAAIKKAPEIAPEEGAGKVAFKIDGTMTVVNTKKALTDARARIAKTPKVMTLGQEYRLVVPAGKAREKDFFDVKKIRKTEDKSLVTDGSFLIRMKLPKQYAKAFAASTGEIPKKGTDLILAAKTQPAEFVYNYMDEPGTEAVAPTSLPVLEPGTPPRSVIRSEGKYYVYNQRYFSTIRKNYPKAELGIGSNGALIAYDNGKPVAAIMAMRDGIGLSEPPLAGQAREAGLLGPVKVVEPAKVAEAAAKAPEKAPRYVLKKKPAAAPPRGAGYFPPPGPEVVPPKQRPEVELPEMVRLAKELMGKPPIIRRLRKFAGLFKSGRGVPTADIILPPATVAADPKFTVQVLSHEIGHLTDWLPDYTLARGNLYGRLLTLRKFMQGVGGEAKEIRAELWKLTKWWNPFDEALVPSSYLKYRKQSRELYADALSVLLSRPKELKLRAPRFYDLFWQHIDRKPEVRDALLRLEEYMSVGEGERLLRRQVEVHEMFQRAEKIWEEKRKLRDKTEKTLWFKLRDLLANKDAALWDKVEAAKRAGKQISADADPTIALEDVAYVGGIRKAHADRIDLKLRDPLKALGVGDETLGEYMLWKMVSNAKAPKGVQDELAGALGTEWVAKRIARPLGHTPETAAKQMKFLLDSLGPKKAAELKTRMDWYYGERQKLMREAHDAGLLTEGMLEMSNRNPYYATTLVSDYLKDYVSAKMLRQVGTFKEAANFFTATVMKDFAVIGAIAKQKANSLTRDFLLSTAPEDITAARVRYTGKHRRELERPPEGKGLLRLFKRGKLVGYFVDPYISNTVDTLPSGMLLGALEWIQWANGTILKPLYTGFNVGFQTNNLIRDLIRSWKLNPDVGLLTHLKSYHRVLRPSFRRAWGIFDPLINEMESRAILGPTYTQMIKGGGALEEETQLQALMDRYQSDKKVSANPISQMLQFIGKVGDAIETLPKAARYKLWKELPSPSQADLKIITREVRGYAGSPPFLLGGRGKAIYNTIFLYSNAAWQGLRWDYIGAVKDPRTRSGYWWKTALTVGLPTTLAYMAEQGFFGDDTKRQFDRMSPWDKANYTVFPMGETDTGRPLYLRFPQDHIGRFVQATVWNILHADKEDPLRSAQKILAPAAQLVTPGMTPVLEMLINLLRFSTGSEPYETFRGRYVLTEEERRAGGWFAIKGMIRYIASNFMLAPPTVYYGRGEPPLSTAEQAIKMTPVLGRYVRVGRMTPESVTRIRQRKARIRARRRLRRKEK